MEKTYILDTSAVLHNWNILTEERTMVLPQCTLDDIDRFQEEPGDIGDNARSAAWWLSQMLNGCDGNEAERDGCRIIFWRDNDEKSHDMKVIRTANDVHEDKVHFGEEVVLLTKSLSLRAKARMTG